MIVDGVDDFFSRGIDFAAFLCFGLLHLGLGIQLGTRFLSGSILLSDLLGRALLSRLLISGGTRHGRRLRVHRDSRCAPSTRASVASAWACAASASASSALLYSVICLLVARRHSGAGGRDGC